MNKAEKVLLIMLIVLNLSGAVFLILERSDNKGVLTGEVILTESILPSISEEEILNVQDSINPYTDYYRTFNLEVSSEVSLNISSDKPIDYVLIKESDVSSYLIRGSFQPISNVNDTLFILENYNLTSGRYSIFLVTSNELVNANILILSREL